MRIERWSLRLRVFLFFALIAAGGAAAIAGAMALVAARAPAGIEDLVLAGGAAGFALVLLTAKVWQLFDENVARPIQLLSGELEARAHASGGGAVETAPARYLGNLGPAAGALAEAVTRERGRASDGVAIAVDAVLAEKAQLEAVLRDLRECVLICNNDHEILLYNAEAERLLGSGAEIGLGRPLFRLITEQPVAHALERLRLRFTSGRWRTHRDRLSVAAVCATRDGRLTLQGRISLILDPEETGADGFVATFRDATALIADHAARDHLLKDMLDGLRRPAANLSAAVEVLEGHEAMDAETRGRFVAVVAEEARVLSGRVERLAGAYDELRVGGWSMNDVTTGALAACVADRLGEGADAPEVAHEGAPTWLNCDSLSVVELLSHLARRVSDAMGTARLGLSATRTGAHVFVDLAWDGPPVGEATSVGWVGEPLTGALAGLTGRDVLLHHRTEIWSDRGAAGRARLRLPLPPAVEDHADAPAAVLPTRPEFYDFALLSRRVPADLRARRLAELSFVVFDCETTGLFPSAGDEIVQIAGVRVLNGRTIRGETFDRLVDPGRRIPAASTRVHGIDDAMVAGKPDARAVLPAFHAFCEGSVLVAHNAPFDLKFLRLKEGLVGVTFDMPVLDTVLLSAHLFGQSAEHTLDRLAERFGARFPEGTRHTALGDALVTAECLCRLIEVLENRGVETLADALAVSDEAGAIRARQAAY